MGGFCPLPPGPATRTASQGRRVGGTFKGPVQAEVDVVNQASEISLLPTTWALSLTHCTSMPPRRMGAGNALFTRLQVVPMSTRGRGLLWQQLSKPGVDLPARHLVNGSSAESWARPDL